MSSGTNHQNRLLDGFATVDSGDQHLIRVGQFQSTRVDIGLAHGEEFGPLTREVIDTLRLELGQPDDTGTVSASD